MLALLLITTSTNFVLNGYLKAYAATNVPTPIPASVKLTLTGFPHQTSESVTTIRLTCHTLDNGELDFCTGTSDIIMPGIGDGQIGAFIDKAGLSEGHDQLVALFTIFSLPGQTSRTDFPIHEAETIHFEIPGIGIGQATAQFIFG